MQQTRLLGYMSHTLLLDSVGKLMVICSEDDWVWGDCGRGIGS